MVPANRIVASVVVSESTILVAYRPASRGNVLVGDRFTRQELRAVEFGTWDGVL